jgi:hypothetical protein
MNTLILLLEIQSQPNLTLRIPPSRQLALREFPKEYEKTESYKINQSQPSHPPLRLRYLSNYHDALQAHMHPLHKLGNANARTNNHDYYQTLIKNGTANGAASKAYLTTSYIPVRTKCIIIKYRTGNLYNQKHALWFKHSISLTCLLCPQLDSALHILLRC